MQNCVGQNCLPRRVSREPEGNSRRQQQQQLSALLPVRRQMGGITREHAKLAIGFSGDQLAIRFSVSNLDQNISE